MRKTWKVFKFPTGFDSEWISISKDKHFESWSFGMSGSLKWFKNRSLDASIDKWLDYSFGRLALECWEGKHEDFCVWRAEEENPKDKQMTTNPSTFWLVWNPEGWSSPKHRHYSLYDAEQEAIRLAQQHPGQEFHVLEVKSKFVAGKITKTEFVESDDVPF